MSGPQLNAFMVAASSCAHEMMDNAAYVEGELPTLAISEAVVGQISAVCSALVGTKHDIVTEVVELGELCGGGEPTDSPVVQRRVERIVRWLGEELPKLHSLLTALEVTAQTPSSAGSAYILVAESAANVYRSFERVSLAADEYGKSVRKT